MQNWLKGGVA